MFREMGGISGSPGGVSQSIIADFKLFVSSERALEDPFCIYVALFQVSHLYSGWLWRSTHHCRNGMNLFLRIAVHELFFKARHTFK